MIISSPKYKKFLLFIGDVLILYLSLWLTLMWRFGTPLNAFIWKLHFLPFTIIYLLWLLIFYILGLYDLKIARNDLNFYSILLKGLIICVLVGLSFFYLIPYFGITPKTILFLNIILFFVLISLWRQIFNTLIKLPSLYQNIIIIGKNSQTIELTEKINSTPQLGYKIVTLIEPKKEKLLEVLQNYKSCTIVTAINLNQHPEIAKILYQHLISFNFEDFPSFYEKITGKIPLSQINEIWLLNNIKESKKEFYEKVKRFIDVVIGIILGIVTIILFIPTAIAIKINSPGPIFYKQKRVGKNGKIFELYKFRSMIKNAETRGAVWAQKNDPRITKVGKVLRKTLIDELPQSINILKGDLSFIGPRPERPEFVEKLEKEIPFYQARHLIKPGLTGWAQVNYKYGNSVEDAFEKLQYDLFYLKNRSIILDFKILLKTVNVALKGGTQ
ncbi:MAG: sugar transferase [Candidatus Pacebacteria bacterium]|nr:sugar transferase [Candidatus Paceibacterota bacterium]